MKKGERYVTLSPIPAIAMTHWSAPYTGGHYVTIPKGTVLVVALDQALGASAVYCRPENYDDLHGMFIPEEDRNAAKYNGYSLIIEVAQLQTSATPT